MTREQRAEMLGGAISVVILKLEDTAKVDLSGYVDLMQVAQIADKMFCEQHGVEVANDVKYVGKQHVQKMFSQLLSAGSQYYILRDGFDTLLDSELLQIVLARSTQAWLYFKGEPLALRLP